MTMKPAMTMKDPRETGVHQAVKPEPPRPEKKDADGLWIAVKNLGSNLNEQGQRLERVEKKADEAHVHAQEALAKVDAVAAKEIEARQAFADAINRKSTSIDSLNSWMKFFAIAVTCSLVASIVTSVAVLAARH